MGFISVTLMENKMNVMEQVIIECFRRVRDDGESKAVMELMERDGFKVEVYKCGIKNVSTFIRIDVNEKRGN